MIDLLFPEAVDDILAVLLKYASPLEVAAFEDIVDRLEKAEADLADYKCLTYCAYCGDMFAADGDAALISEHIKTCINHPIRQAEADRDRLREYIIGLERYVLDHFERKDLTEKWIKEHRPNMEGKP